MNNYGIIYDVRFISISFFFPYSYTTMDINFSNTEIQIPHLPYTKLSFLNLYRR